MFFNFNTTTKNKWSGSIGCIDMFNLLTIMILKEEKNTISLEHNSPQREGENLIPLSPRMEYILNLSVTIQN